MASQPPLSGMVMDESVFAPVMGLVVGTGSTRVVVEYLGQPDLVIKVSFRHSHVSNWAEWHLWHQVADEPSLAAVFGQCAAISASGKYLVMERLNDVSAQQGPARRAPPWITDRKPSAFGVNAANEIKLRDYAQQKTGFFLARFPPEPVAK